MAEEVSYSVRFKNGKVVEMARKMPQLEQKKLVNLIDDLTETGPIQTGWRNFSSLGGNKYHCHLSYKWVACWEYYEEETLIEVYYAGSRENAPY